MLKALGGDAPQTNRSEGNAHIAAIREALSRPQAIVTGIGSRETPQSEMDLLTRIASAAEKRGMRGRSGGAGGADLAFERGFIDPRNIDVIVPWKGFLPKGMTQRDVDAFLGRPRPMSGPGAPVMLPWDKRQEAEEKASHYHPAWHKCSPGAKSLHTRNIPQVVGLELDRPADLVVAWTVDGKATGGTGQAIRMAQDIGVPVANLKNPEEKKAVMQALGIQDRDIGFQRAQAQAYEAQGRFGR
ncbi:hypothetical protein [uncultured Salinicola sp.]|uniref:hypothetical protein n=1 Tax=uncultured Salinicola sp. TaxID=1193542 RepID=UPI00262BFD31|nr:hypothetical protein [uncultured Salinicola sp.]|tara:strand:+ start:2256 stop:2984 length:729 start_codon:yes stop_codon:yes gene_type:complete